MTMIAHPSSPHSSIFGDDDFEIRPEFRIFDPMDPLSFRGGVNIVEQALSRLGFFSAFERFRISDTSKTSPTAFSLELADLTPASTSGASASAAAGHKMGRARSEVSLKLSNIDEIRLFTHVVGDSYLQSVKSLEGFDVSTFLEKFKTILTKLPPIAGFDKTNFLGAIDIIKKVDESLQDHDINKIELQKAFKRKLIEKKEELFNAEFPLISERDYEGIDGAAEEKSLESDIWDHPLPEITSNFQYDMYAWCMDFFKRHAFYLKPIDHQTYCWFLAQQMTCDLYHIHLEKLNQFCAKLKENLEALKIGDLYFLPSGFSGIYYGHYCIISIKKTSETCFELKLYNVGLGVEKHHHCIIKNSTAFFQPFKKFKDVPKAVLFSIESGSYDALLSFLEFNHPIHSAYHTLTRTGALEKAFYENLNIHFGSYVELTPESGYSFIKPQKTGTCVYRSTKALLTDFCSDGAVYRSVVREIKRISFYSCFSTLARSASLLNRLSVFEKELLLRCNNKLLGLVRKELTPTRSDHAPIVQFLADISAASKFVKNLPSESFVHTTFSSRNLFKFVGKIGIIPTQNFISVISKSDALKTKVVKHSIDLLSSISHLSLENKFRYLSQLLHADAASNVTIPNSYDVLDLFSSFSLNDENLFHGGITDPNQFLKDLYLICNHLEKEESTACRAIYGKSYLLAHKLAIELHSDLLSDLPISFGGTETDKYIQDVSFEFYSSFKTSTIFEDCSIYVEAFNEGCSDKKSYLFEHILSDEIAFDSSFSKPVAEIEHSDFILYQRLLAKHHDLIGILSVKKQKNHIELISDLFSFPAFEINHPELFWLSYLKKFKIHFDSQDYEKVFSQDKHSFDRFTCRSDINPDANLLIYHYTNPLMADDINWDQLISDASSLQDRLNLRQLQELASNDKTRWLELCNFLMDPDKLLWLQDHVEELKPILYRSSEEDPFNNLIISDIKNKHFQAKFIKNLIDALLTLSKSEEGLELALVFMPVFAKIMPEIDQKFIDFDKFHKILLSIFSLLLESDDCEYDGYMHEWIPELIAHVDLSLCESVDVDLSELIVKFFIELYKYSLVGDIRERRCGELFSIFFQKNESLLSTRPDIAQNIFDKICESFSLPSDSLNKIIVDKAQCHTEFFVNEDFSYYLDNAFHVFVKDDAGEFVIASNVLQRPAYNAYLKSCCLDSVQDVRGNTKFIYGTYNKATGLLIPSTAFEMQLPSYLSGLRWSLHSIKNRETIVGPAFTLREILLTLAPSLEYLLFSQSAGRNCFILLDDSHNPIITLTISVDETIIYDCRAKKIIKLPEKDHTLAQFLSLKQVKFYAYLPKNGFELEIKSQNTTLDRVIFPKEASPYLQDRPHYKQMLHDSFPHFPLYFKNTSSSDDPDIIFFTPRALEQNRLTQAIDYNEVFKVFVKNEAIISDNHGVLCYMAYAFIMSGNYHKAKLILDPFNKRNKLLHLVKPHELKLIEWLINKVEGSYEKYRVDSPIIRYFILTIYHFFDPKEIHDKFIHQVLRDYLQDRHKHPHEQLPFEHFKGLADKFNLNLTKEDLVSYLAEFKKSISKEDVALIEAQIAKRDSQVETINLPAPQLNFTVKSILTYLQNRNQMGSNGTFLDFLGWTKSKTINKKILLKQLIGRVGDDSVLLRTLIKEQSIAARLLLDSDKLPETAEFIFSNLSTLLTHLEPSLRFEVGMKYAPFNEKRQAVSSRMHSMAVHAAVPIFPLGVRVSSSFDMRLSPSQGVASSFAEVDVFIEDIINYNRFLKLFITHQVSLASPFDKQRTFSRCLGSLISSIERFAQSLETQLTHVCQNHIKKMSARTGFIEEIFLPEPIIFKDLEVLTFDTLVDAFLKNDPEAYHQIISSYNPLAQGSLKLEDASLYKALDHQVGFCVYLKVLTSYLKTAQDSLQKGKFGFASVDDMIAHVSSNNALMSKPRQQLVFEYRFGHTTTSKQKEIIDFLTDTAAGIDSYKLAQVIMGGGKSSVIVPMLSSIFANGKNACILITPQSQISSILKFLEPTLNQIYNKGVELLNFREDLSEAYLKSILHKLRSPVSIEKLFISTPESLQFLELELLKLLGADGRSSAEYNKRITLIKNLLLLLQNKTSTIIDEFSCVSDVTKYTNVPLASKDHRQIKIPAEYITHTQDLFDCLHILLKLEDITLLDVAQNWHVYLDQVLLMLLKQSSFEREGVDKAQIEEFLKNPSSDEFNEDKPLCFIKYLLTSVLPHTLERTCGRHYGRTFNDSIEGKVVPYQGVSSPSSTEFGHFYEAMCYHYLTCLQTSYSRSEVAFLIQELVAVAQANADRFNCDISDTIEAQIFNDAFGFSIEKAQEEDAEENAYSYNQQLYAEGFLSPMMPLETLLVKRYVKITDSYLSSNPHNLISQFSKVSGFTGTPWNKDSYNHVFDKAQKFDSRIEDSIDDLFISKSEEVGMTLIFQPPSKDPRALLEFFLSHPDFRKISSFIDTGGIFSGLSNHKVAETIALFYLEKYPATLRFDVIYFDRSSRSLTPDVPTVLTATKSGATINCHAKTLEGLKPADLRKAGVVSGNYFVYFDERHTIGTDIALSEDAIGIITVDKKLTHHAFLQGLMRLRQYDKLQNAFVVNFDENLKSISDHSLFIEELIKQEKKQLEPIVYRSLKLEIHDLVRQKILYHILNSATAEEMKVLYAKFRSVFETNEQIDPVILLDEALLAHKPVESLRHYVNTLLTEKIKAKLSPLTIFKINELLKKAERYFEDSTFTSSIELGTEVHIENEQEVDVDQEKVKVLDRDVLAEIALFSKRESISPAMEYLFPIDEVLAHFQKSKKIFDDEDNQFTIAPVNYFADDLEEDNPAQAYQECFSFMITSNALKGSDDTFLDVLSRDKKPIASVLAVLHLEKQGAMNPTYAKKIIFIGLTKEETDTCFIYLNQHPEASASLISLDQEIITSSVHELLIKEVMSPAMFIPIYAYNGQVRKLMDHSLDTYYWANDRRMGALRRRFLQIQGAIHDSPLHDLVLELCISAETEPFYKRKEERQIDTLIGLRMELENPPEEREEDFDQRISKFIKGLPINQLNILHPSFYPYVPLYLKRHLTIRVPFHCVGLVMKIQNTMDRMLANTSHSSWEDEID